MHGGSSIDGRSGGDGAGVFRGEAPAGGTVQLPAASTYDLRASTILSTIQVILRVYLHPSWDLDMGPEESMPAPT